MKIIATRKKNHSFTWSYFPEFKMVNRFTSRHDKSFVKLGTGEGSQGVG